MPDATTWTFNHYSTYTQRFVGGKIECRCAVSFESGYEAEQHLMAVHGVMLTDIERNYAKVT